ncbi:MAG: hypothetical protein ACKOCT_17845 [Alphaproteobacteria bacterium]
MSEGAPAEARRCELCDLVRSTRWYAEFHEPVRFTVLDCDSCDVPMAVLGEHRAAATDDEKAVMTAVLRAVTDSLGLGEVTFDDRMRQIPDHYHVHARPLPAWWPRPR